MLAPVVLFVYNRLDHTKGVIETLSKNRLAKETELFIFSDAAKTENGREKVESVRKYVHQKDWHGNFKQVTITEAEKNKGLARSVIGGVTELINKYGRVIVVEDDLVLSPYFLDYMNDALEFYEKEENIWAISGYSFPMKSLKKYPHDVFYSYRGCSWGWATWADRWNLTDWEVSSYERFSKDKEWQKRFNRGGGDLANMLRLQMEGQIDSWAVRWVFEQSNREMYTVYPKYSYLGNDGWDGSGTNCGIDRTFIVSNEHGIEKCNFEKLEIDKHITRDFYLKYTDTLDKKIKRNLKKIKTRILNR